MSPSTLSTLLHSLPHAEQTGPYTPGFFLQKVGGKMFALFKEDDGELRLNLKCDPDRAIELREQYESIIPGYHMNKKHWNTLILDASLDPALVKELIHHSYDLVFASLTKKVRESLS